MTKSKKIRRVKTTKRTKRTKTNKKQREKRNKTKKLRGGVKIKIHPLPDKLKERMEKEGRLKKEWMDKRNKQLVERESNLVERTSRKEGEREDLANQYKKEQQEDDDYFKRLKETIDTVSVSSSSSCAGPGNLCDEETKVLKETQFEKIISALFHEYKNIDAAEIHGRLYELQKMSEDNKYIYLAVGLYVLFMLRNNRKPNNVKELIDFNEANPIPDYTIIDDA